MRLARQLLAGLPGRDRHRHDDAARPEFAQRLHRRTHRRSGRQPIVDRERRAAAHVNRGPVTAVEPLSTVEFAALLSGLSASTVAVSRRAWKTRRR